jgi:hypothetical protein
MVIVTCAGTGWPFRVAGSYWNCFKDSTAAGRNEGGPESTLMKFTSPAVPTTASITTFPVSKSRRASKEATALTDLINFGGTMALSGTDGATESGAAFAVVGTGERLIANAAEGDVFLTVGCATETLDPKGRLGDSLKSLGSGGTVLGSATLRNGIPAEVTGASLATLALWNSD